MNNAKEAAQNQRATVQLPRDLARYDVGTQAAVREFARECLDEDDLPPRKRWYRAALIAAGVLALLTTGIVWP